MERLVPIPDEHRRVQFIIIISTNLLLPARIDKGGRTTEKRKDISARLFTLICS